MNTNNIFTKDNAQIISKYLSIRDIVSCTGVSKHFNTIFSKNSIWRRVAASIQFTPNSGRIIDQIKAIVNVEKPLDNFQDLSLSISKFINDVPKNEENFNPSWSDYRCTLNGNLHDYIEISLSVSQKPTVNKTISSQFRRSSPIYSQSLSSLNNTSMRKKTFNVFNMEKPTSSASGIIDQTEKYEIEFNRLQIKIYVYLHYSKSLNSLSNTTMDMDNSYRLSEIHKVFSNKSSEKLNETIIKVIKDVKISQ